MYRRRRSADIRVSMDVARLGRTSSRKFSFLFATPHAADGATRRGVCEQQHNGSGPAPGAEAAHM